MLWNWFIGYVAVSVTASVLFGFWAWMRTKDRYYHD